jgi:UDP-N-acetyl-D-mannosaminuronic acid transferase (WecB/TagA/CpsF family)
MTGEKAGTSQGLSPVRLRERLTDPVLIVNGGAILDFLGGKVMRARELLRNTGLEWVYRLY